MPAIEKSYSENEYAVDCDLKIKKYFTEKGWEILKSTNKEDWEDGIDYWLIEPGNEIPYAIDMKNTKHLYFLNFNLDKEMVFGRKPFSVHTKATHYFFINLYLLVPIKEHMKNYLSDVDEFLNIIEAIEDKPIDEVVKALEAKSIDQACLLIKNMLKPYVKPGYAINYKKDSFSKQNKISFKIYETKNL